jgi:hypothetical protein
VETICWFFVGGTLASNPDYAWLCFRGDATCPRAGAHLWAHLVSVKPPFFCSIFMCRVLFKVHCDGTRLGACASGNILSLARV